MVKAINLHIKCKKNCGFEIDWTECPNIEHAQNYFLGWNEAHSEKMSCIHDYEFQVVKGKIWLPRHGFKSITVTEQVYDNFYEVYSQIKEELNSKGVSSFAGYIAYLLENSVKNNELLQKYPPRFKKICDGPDRIILEDTKIKRIVELTKKSNKLYCLLCEKNSCVHVGYCYSLHKLYPLKDWVHMMNS